MKAPSRTDGGVGLTSLLMDTSSEMIHALLPLFLTSVLGVGALAVGLIEGVAEATAALTKVFSGTISDWIGKRKPLVLLGYGLAAATKPLFALAPSVGWVVGARVTDRIGKGIRGAPRDALIADICAPGTLGAAYGLRQSMDTVGAFAGPLIAVLAMAWSGGDFRLVFWIATVPALLAVLVIVGGVDEPEEHRRRSARPPPSWSDTRRFPARFWGVVAISAVMTLARFSEAFLLLRAQSVGMAPEWVPLVMVVMNLASAGCSWPVGILSDRIGRRGLLLGGFALLVVADLVLAEAGGVAAVMAGVVLWGLHSGATQGLLSALVADTAPAELRGTAYGVFNLASGLAALAASIIAGALWSVLGPAATFVAGAVFSAVAVAALLAWRSRA